MKNRYFLLVVLLVSLNSINAQNTYVPDDNFEKQLIEKGYDTGTPDNYVPTENIKSVPTLDIQGKNISDLTGIGDFVGLQILRCENNQLTSLDMTGAIALRELYCGNNLLTELIVYQNSALTILSCFGNKLTALDVRQNDKLTTLVCSDNLIINLKVTGAVALTRLLCDKNQIVRLDLSENIALTTLNCANNQLTIVNVHNGHNDLITSFNASNNAALTCIEVDDADKANNKLQPYTYWSKPTSATYSEACILPTTWVPDVNFELALQAKGYDAGPPDHYVYTYEIAMVYDLDVGGKVITDLTGIGDFQNLGHLDCSHNDIINLDLSRNSGLIDLKCNNNQLVTLNVRNGHNTLITTFNATGNPALK
jgi:membrane-bound inhibitor of C-type lysozyme